MIRAAVEEDMIELLALYEQWTMEQTDYRGHWDQHEGFGAVPDERFRGATRESSQYIGVSEQGASVVGAVVASLVDLVDEVTAAAICRIDWMFVQESSRHAGVAGELFGAAREWAEDMGAVGIEIGVLPGHRDAKNFCERRGLKARLLVMSARWD